MRTPFVVFLPLLASFACTSDVASTPPSGQASATAPTHVPSGRFVNATACADRLRAHPWGASAIPIPATVISVGVMQRVPYVSTKAGDYEMNVYGDPAAPAGVEIGIYRTLLSSDEAKANCIAFMQEVLVRGSDDTVVGRLNLKEDRTSNDGLSFEVTPATAPDAYGGWWVSVFDRDDLEKARASEPEIAAITEPKAAPKVWTNADIEYSRPSSSYASSSYSSPSSSGGGGSGGDTVYVKGYYRSNGTYVHPYTRSAPHRK